MNREMVRAAVTEALTSLGTEHFVEEESGAVVVPFRSEKENEDFLIVFDIFEDYFMILGIFPAEVDPEDEDEMIRFVNMMNEDLRYGRFVYDEEEADVQYRLAYLGNRKRISRELIKEYFKTAYGTILCYRDGILDVWSGALAEEAYAGLGLDEEESLLPVIHNVTEKMSDGKHQESKILRPFDKKDGDRRR